MVVLGIISYILIIAVFGGYFLAKWWGDRQQPADTLNEEAGAATNTHN